MSQCPISSTIKYQRVSNAVAAGTTDVESDVVDLLGAESVVFQVFLGAMTASTATVCKIQHSDASGSGFEDVTDGAAGAADGSDDNQVVVLEYFRSKKRYARVVVVRATANAVIDAIGAEIHGLRSKPPTNGATIHSVTQAVGY